MRENLNKSSELIEKKQELKRNMQSMPTKRLKDLHLKLLVPKLNITVLEKVKMLLVTISELFIRQKMLLAKKLRLLKINGNMK